MSQILNNEENGETLADKEVNKFLESRFEKHLLRKHRRES